MKLPCIIVLGNLLNNPYSRFFIYLRLGIRTEPQGLILWMFYLPVSFRCVNHVQQDNHPVASTPTVHSLHRARRWRHSPGMQQRIDFLSYVDWSRAVRCQLRQLASHIGRTWDRHWVGVSYLRPTQNLLWATTCTSHPIWLLGQSSTCKLSRVG